jgi:glycosidase
MIGGCSDDTNHQKPFDPSSSWDGLCETSFHHAPSSPVDEVRIVGAFNNWNSSTQVLEEWTDGHWSTSIRLAPGPHAYRFVEFTEWVHDGAMVEVCDPNADLAICNESTFTDLRWSQECTGDSTDCDSMIYVPDCNSPQIHVQNVNVNRPDGRVQLRFKAVPGSEGDPNVSVGVFVDGLSVELIEEDGLFHVEQSDMAPGRVQFDIEVIDGAGETNSVSVPIWMDEWSWDQAIIYHALIDRVANGNTDNDPDLETTHPITDWAGGDIEGLTLSLPYLDSLGINTIWISNPQLAPEGAWDGDCDATYSGYHGFWPSSWTQTEPRLGAENLKEFIDAAHDRKMRVVMDWVGNHVHSEHELTQDLSAFHPEALCRDINGAGEQNWDAIPESCWFTPYLPDADHTQPLISTAIVEMGVQWATQYQLDGLRVDAAKHMPHTVSYNLRARVHDALEHEGTGFDFNLIGETFDHEELINAYIGPDQLHGQFDFPLYWTLREAFVNDTASVAAAVQTAANIRNRYPEGRMSTFLGNLDVGRFLTDAIEHTADVCPDGDLRQANSPDDDVAYDRLRLAFTVLFTQPGMPMIYYGDELGLPGYTDPDNRQPLWWHGADLTAHDAESLMGELAPGPRRVLDTVRRLAHARAEHPALRGGEWTEWWNGGDGLYATAHTHGDDAAIVIINRTDEEQWLDNDIVFANLPTGTYIDVLSDESFMSVSNRLALGVSSFSSRVLVPAN